MNTYAAADNRATTTLYHMIQPYSDAVTASTTLNEIVRAINQHLPPGLAYNTELRLRIFRVHNHDFITQKLRALEITKEIIEIETSRDLPAIVDRDDNKFYYYLREDLVNWFKSSPTNAEYLQTPPDEVITIQINYGDRVKTSALTLNQDQMIGIAYGLYGLNDGRVTLRSSITNAPVSINDIAEHALIYRLPIELATEKIKRPYSVDILTPNKTFMTVHFQSPEFMQGVLSVAQWYHLPNQGKDYLWRNLSQFTREGIIPLTF